MILIGYVHRSTLAAGGGKLVTNSSWDGVPLHQHRKLSAHEQKNHIPVYIEPSFNDLPKLTNPRPCKNHIEDCTTVYPHVHQDNVVRRDGETHVSRVARFL